MNKNMQNGFEIAAAKMTKRFKFSQIDGSLCEY